MATTPHHHHRHHHHHHHSHSGKLDRFQFESVDAVATGDLSSGKSDAKAMRKALNAGVDVLRERVTALHSAL